MFTICKVLTVQIEEILTHDQTQYFGCCPPLVMDRGYVMLYESPNSACVQFSQ